MSRVHAREVRAGDEGVRGGRDRARGVVAGRATRRRAERRRRATTTTTNRRRSNDLVEAFGRFRIDNAVIGPGLGGGAALEAVEALREVDGGVRRGRRRVEGAGADERGRGRRGGGGEGRNPTALATPNKMELWRLVRKASGAFEGGGDDDGFERARGQGENRERAATVRRLQFPRQGRGRLLIHSTLGRRAVGVGQRARGERRRVDRSAPFRRRRLAETLRRSGRHSRRRPRGFPPLVPAHGRRRPRAIV